MMSYMISWHVVPQGNESGAVGMIVIRCYEVKQANIKRQTYSDNIKNIIAVKHNTTQGHT